MVSPGEVNLLIFDTDGTITPTTRPVYEAIKKVFGRLDWPVTFSIDEIEKFFGMTGGELYQFIAPAGVEWQAIRDRAREEYADSFREYGETYPGIKKTLEILRERGYRLVLFSNASPVYFNTVKSALEIERYFDYTECIGENDLSKPELIRKIKETFGGIDAAVVGDRYHDIDAARETGSLSIGAMYGYGGDEPEKADIVIHKFVDLLDIFGG
jgi:phosphoglycolate phosphatase